MNLKKLFGLKEKDAADQAEQQHERADQAPAPAAQHDETVKGFVDRAMADIEQGRQARELYLDAAADHYGRKREGAMASRMFQPVLDAAEAKQLYQLGLNGEPLPDSSKENIEHARVHLDGLQARSDFEEEAAMSDTEATQSDGRSQAALQAVLDAQQHYNSLLAKQAEVAVDGLEQQAEGLSLAEAAGRALSTANDPLNKALRGVGDHLQGKINEQKYGQNNFYQRMGLQSPDSEGAGAQHDLNHAEREGPEMEL